MNFKLTQRVSGVGVFEVVVDAAHLKGSAHQVATIGGRNLVNLKGVIVRVGELQLDRLTALSTGVDRLGREQGVTLRAAVSLTVTVVLVGNSVKIASPLLSVVAVLFCALPASVIGNLRSKPSNGAPSLSVFMTFSFTLSLGTVVELNDNLLLDSLTAGSTKMTG